MQVFEADPDSRCLQDVLEVVAEVVDLVDGVLESLGPLLNSVG